MHKRSFASDLSYAKSVMRILDCPRALTVFIMLEHGMWDEVVSLEIDPCWYQTAEDFRRAYQATKLLSKSNFLPTSFDKRAKALSGFREAEKLCRETNQIFLSHRQGRTQFRPWVEAAMSAAQRKIAAILGTDLYDWVSFASFGPGSDCSTTRGLTSVYNKLEQKGGITSECLPYLKAFEELTLFGTLHTYDLRGRPCFPIRSGNTITTVPKNSKTDRTIAVEPRWNMFFQKGVGSWLRRRLKRHGVNLDDQSVNQQRALRGSRDGTLATIDLSSASDSISKEIIFSLLPPAWAHLLDNLRSKTYTLEKQVYVYEKWSSMGNGYTFELESMLFWALASSVADDVTVYGDDIICDSGSADRVIELLRVCGFRVNHAKTFTQGAFRESCGCDAFNGIIVTPIYWKDSFEDKPVDRVNQTMRMALDSGDGVNPDRRYRSLWHQMERAVPKSLRVYGPPTISSNIHAPFEKWRVERRNGWAGWFLSTITYQASRLRYRDEWTAVLSSLFLNCDSVESIPRYLGRGYTVRDRTKTCRSVVFVPEGGEHIGRWQ